MDQATQCRHGLRDTIISWIEEHHKVVDRGICKTCFQSNNLLAEAALLQPEVDTRSIRERRDIKGSI